MQVQRVQNTNNIQVKNISKLPFTEEEYNAFKNSSEIHDPK